MSEQFLSSTEFHGLPHIELDRCLEDNNDCNPIFASRAGATSSSTLETVNLLRPIALMQSFSNVFGANDDDGCNYKLPGLDDDISSTLMAPSVNDGCLCPTHLGEEMTDYPADVMLDDLLKVHKGYNTSTENSYEYEDEASYYSEETVEYDDSLIAFDLFPMPDDDSQNGQLSTKQLATLDKEKSNLEAKVKNIKDVQDYKFHLDGLFGSFDWIDFDDLDQCEYLEFADDEEGGCSLGFDLTTPKVDVNPARLVMLDHAYCAVRPAKIEVDLGRTPGLSSPSSPENHGEISSSTSALDDLSIGGGCSSSSENGLAVSLDDGISPPGKDSRNQIITDGICYCSEGVLVGCLLCLKNQPPVVARNLDGVTESPSSSFKPPAISRRKVQAASRVADQTGSKLMSTKLKRHQLNTSSCSPDGHVLHEKPGRSTVANVGHSSTARSTFKTLDVNHNEIVGKRQRAQNVCQGEANDVETPLPDSTSDDLGGSENSQVRAKRFKAYVIDVPSHIDSSQPADRIYDLTNQRTIRLKFNNQSAARYLSLANHSSEVASNLTGEFQLIGKSSDEGDLWTAKGLRGGDPSSVIVDYQLSGLQQLKCPGLPAAPENPRLCCKKEVGAAGGLADVGQSSIENAVINIENNNPLVEIKGLCLPPQDMRKGRSDLNYKERERRQILKQRLHRIHGLLPYTSIPVTKQAILRSATIYIKAMQNYMEKLEVTLVEERHKNLQLAKQLNALQCPKERRSMPLM